MIEQACIVIVEDEGILVQDLSQLKCLETVDEKYKSEQ